MAITTAIVAIGGAIAGGVKQHHDQKRAEKAADKQEAAQRGMQQEYQQRQAQDDALAAEQGKQAALRQRAVASGYRNASGGFSTSPLGLPGDGNTAKGGLLGL